MHQFGLTTFIEHEDYHRLTSRECDLALSKIRGNVLIEPVAIVYGSLRQNGIVHEII